MTRAQKLLSFALAGGAILFVALHTGSALLGFVAGGFFGASILSAAGRI
jgi:hypothetical protein